MLTTYIVPVLHGDDVADRTREASAGTIDAFIDLYGHGYVELALELGVPAARVDTIVDFARSARTGHEIVLVP